MALEKEGYRVTCLPVDCDGLLKLADLEAAITDQTAVVSLMWAFAQLRLRKRISCEWLVLPTSRRWQKSRHQSNI